MLIKTIPQVLHLLLHIRSMAAACHLQRQSPFQILILFPQLFQFIDVRIDPATFVTITELAACLIGVQGLLVPVLERGVLGCSSKVEVREVGVSVLTCVGRGEV